MHVKPHATQDLVDIIVRKRKELGISQSELSRRVGLSRKYTTMIESRIRRPSRDAAIRYGTALGIPRDELSVHILRMSLKRLTPNDSVNTASVACEKLLRVLAQMDEKQIDTVTQVALAIVEPRKKQ